MNWFRDSFCRLLHTSRWCGLVSDGRHVRGPAGEYALRCGVCGRPQLVAPHRLAGSPTMTDPDLSAAILAALRADGGACEAVFRAPLFALADWFRERGRDDFADALTGEDVDGYAWRLRDAAYLAGSNRERRRMRAYTREVLAARAAEG